MQNRYNSNKAIPGDNMKNLKSLIVIGCSVVAFGFFIALDCEEETEDPAAQPAVTEQTPDNTETQNNTLRTIVMQYPGCIKQEDIGAIIDYSRNHNHQPYNQTIRNGLDNGSCSIFEKGEQVLHQ